jgi:Domain of unknown function (DUF4166)/Saccharopine dehydrogenase NADP binding domain
MITVLILGGYGVFGGRLAQLLADEPSLTLIIAGRSHDEAARFCSTLPPGAQKIAAALDRNVDLDAALRRFHPDVVVDATGPFQAYGDDPYRVVKACLAHGVNYMDLADGSRFVAGIGIFDEAARARGVFLLAGVSSFPVLTAAVVRDLSRGMMRVDAITAGIAPSPYAGVGLNVIRAIAGYAGQPVALRRHGKDTTGYALVETKRCTIAPPGRLPLRNIRFSLVDVPDLQVLPQLWPEVRDIWTGAGPVPEILHRALNGLAWLVRVGILPSLSPFAPLFHRVINVLRWGEHRGGMFVSVAGPGRDGTRLRRSWHLLAEGDDGPLIPSMAVAAIVRRMLAGQAPTAGARPATRELELRDYETILARRRVNTGYRDEATAPDSAPLYQQLLGDAWRSLPLAIRAMHDFGETMSAEGVATVERGSGLLSRLAAFFFGFPRAGEDIPVSVFFERSGASEIWRRRFGAQSFSSLQWAGTGRWEHLLVERFGPFSVALALVVEDETLSFVSRGWRFLGVPLPAVLRPRGHSYEREENGRFAFQAEIAHPLTGLIVRYRGTLNPRAAAVQPRPHDG